MVTRFPIANIYYELHTHAGIHIDVHKIQNYFSYDNTQNEIIITVNKIFMILC